MKILCLLGLKEVHQSGDALFDIPQTGHYIFGAHSKYHQTWHLLRTKGIYIERDLRDVAVSLLEYATVRVSDYPVKQTLLQSSDPLRDVIIGVNNSFPSLKKRYNDLNEWKKHPNVLHTRYEWIVKNTDREVSRICTHLDIKDTKLDHSLIFNCSAGQLYHGNFRKGIIGDHKNVFKPHHYKIFNKELGDIYDT
jgi:hypothetical protein